MARMIWVIQILSIAFAFFLAKHNAPSVTIFERHGATDKELHIFHRNGFLCKSVFAIAMGLILVAFNGGNTYEVIKTGLIASLLSAFWIYMLFDPILNRSRIPSRPLDYIGLNDADGRRLTKWFGKNAGELKAVICLLIILILNVLNYFI